VIEIAKGAAQRAAPQRTIVFMAITGEEVGGFGTRWYIAHPVRPLDKTVVDPQRRDDRARRLSRRWLRQGVADRVRRSSMG
jgi:hypothetical protein